MRYEIFFETSSGPATGLTSTWSHLVKQSDRSSIPGGSRPAITECGNGIYYFDSTTTETLTGVIDAGSATVIGRYRPIVFGPNDNKLTIVEQPSGTYTISITTKQADTTAIPGVQVAILNGSGQTVRTVTTNSSGIASITLDTGDYTTKAFKAMTNISDVTFTVADNMSVAIVGTLVNPSTPVDGVQTIYFIPDDPGLLLDTTAVVTATVDGLNNFTGDALITREPIRAVNRTTHFEMSVGKGLIVNISGKSSSGEFYYKKITVTSDNTRSLKDYV
jgi:hypothetical protein